MRIHRNDEGLLCAASFEMGRCGHCPHIHIVLKDEDGEPFACLVITNDQAIAIGLEADIPELRGETTQ